MQIDVYGYESCFACIRARRLLDAKGYRYTYRDINVDPVAKAEMLKRNPAAKTVPQIFVGKRHIGGLEELETAERANIIQQLIGGE